MLVLIVYIVIIIAPTNCSKKNTIDRISHQGPGNCFGLCAFDITFIHYSINTFVYDFQCRELKSCSQKSRNSINALTCTMTMVFIVNVSKLYCIDRYLLNNL